MIELERLEFENIGSFVGKHSVDFSNKSKILQVDGVNLNTGGSSGSGKSTLFHINDLILGINDVPLSLMQSRETNSPWSAVGYYKVNGVELKIDRSKKNGLVVSYGDEVIEGNNKLAEEKIDQILKIPRDLLKKMIHKKQKEGGFFLNLTAKESYSFLIKCLGLEEWELKVDKIDKELKQDVLLKNSLESTINSNAQRLLDIDNSKNAVVAPNHIDIPLLQSKKDEISEKIRNLKQDVVIKEQFFAEKARDISLLIPPTPLTDKNKINEIKESEKLSTQEIVVKIAQILESKKSLEAKISCMRGKLSEIDRAKEKRIEALEKIDILLRNRENIIKSNTCNACEQHLPEDKLSSQLNKIDIEGTYLGQQVKEFELLIQNEERLLSILESSSQKLSEYISDIAKLELEKSSIIQKNQFLIESEQNKIESELKNYSLLVQSLKNEHSNKILLINQEKNTILNELNQQISDLSAKSFKIENIIANYSLEMERYKKITDTLNSQYNQISNELSQKRDELESLNNAILVKEESKRLIKSFNLKVFQDTLNFIGNYATDLISGVPLMDNASIYLENSKETKSGKIKDEVSCVVNINGEEVNLKTLSGGERTSAELAVDLAVVEVIQSQTGVGANFIILDEPFVGLDPIGAAACVDIIKRAGLKKRIIIVDHGSETKQMFDESITITKSGNRSTIN